MSAIHRRAGRLKEAEGFEYAASQLPEDQSWANPFTADLATRGRGQKILVETITSHEAVGNYPAAVETARRLADMYPTPRSQLLLGRALGYTGDYDAAIPVLEDAIHGDPNLVMAHAFLGVARFELAERAHAAGQRAVADSYYHKAVAALDKAVE